MSRRKIGTIPADMPTASERAFKEDFCRRVQELRQARGFTQEQMATALGVPLDRYKKYEIRSPLPPHLLERFALIVGRDVNYVVTGKTGRRLVALPEPSPAAPRKKGRR